MRWVLVLCLVVGCAENAGMRPRGLRNSVRIESLERRIATTETALGITPERAPPEPRTDLERSATDRRVDALEERLRIIDDRIATLLTTQSVIQRDLATLRMKAEAAPPASVPAPTPP